MVQPKSKRLVTESSLDATTAQAVTTDGSATRSALDARYVLVSTPTALTAGSVMFVRKNGSTWPARPTDRTDIMVLWVGSDPGPNIVSSGTGGMIDGVDARLVSP